MSVCVCVNDLDILPDWGEGFPVLSFAAFVSSRTIVSQPGSQFLDDRCNATHGLQYYGNLKVLYSNLISLQKKT